MKNILLSLVAFLFAFIIGCQESSITDPVLNDTGSNYTAEETIYLDKDILSYFPGVINLEGTLKDPSHAFNTFVDIKGVARYRVTRIYTAKRSPQPAIKVEMYVKAELTGGYSEPNNVWTVSGVAENIRNTTPANQAAYTFEKAFRVSNSKIPLNLVLKFQVDEKVVTLVSMELKLAKGWAYIPDPSL